MLKAINILSTKLLQDEHAQQLKDSGFNLQMESFIDITLNTTLHFPKAELVSAIFTSINAVKAIEPYISLLPKFEIVFCIEGITSAAARSLFGPHQRIVSAPYADALVINILEIGSKNEYWFFKGNLALPTIPKALGVAGLNVRLFEVYTNELKPHKITKAFEAILFFSPSAVKSYLMNNFIPNNTITFAIGKTTAAALETHAKHIVMSEETSESSMVKAVCKQFF